MKLRPTRTLALIVATSHHKAQRTAAAFRAPTCYRAVNRFLVLEACCLLIWQEWRDSNPQPAVLETAALPIELHSCDAGPCGENEGLVELGGFEPPTSAMRTQRSPK
jgi:hypothetical protein